MVRFSKNAIFRIGLKIPYFDTYIVYHILIPILFRRGLKCLVTPSKLSIIGFLGAHGSQKATKIDMSMDKMLQAEPFHNSAPDGNFGTRNFEKVARQGQNQDTVYLVYPRYLQMWFLNI